MKIIVTGGIGSGKSTVCELLKKEFYNSSIQYFSVDKLVEELYARSDIQSKLIDVFNTCVKSELSRLAFTDITAKNTIENIFSAPLREQIFFIVTHIGDVILEFPLLAEYGNTFIPKVDYVINVESFLSLRINRIMARDHKSKAEAERIIKTQVRDSERRKISDFIIENNEHVEENVKRIAGIIKGKTNDSGLGNTNKPH